MSAYKEIKTEFKTLDSLKKALADVGFDFFEVSDNPKVNSIQLQGYGGRRGEKVALMLPSSHYEGYEDTGFAWDEETRTYRAIISTHDGWGNFGEETLTKLRQRYANHEVRRVARAKGYTCREVKSTDGTIRLQLTHR